MKQITVRGGKYYYGSIAYNSCDAVYTAFREDYHAPVSNRFYDRLDRPERQERIHGFHVWLTDDLQMELDHEFGIPKTRVRYYLLGMIHISYCRMLADNYTDCEDEAKYWRWLDWVISHADTMMKRVGRNESAGRTSRRRKRYR